MLELAALMSIGWLPKGEGHPHSVIVTTKTFVVAPAPCLFAPVASEASGIGKALACRRSGASRIR